MSNRKEELAYLGKCILSRYKHPDDWVVIYTNPTTGREPYLWGLSIREIDPTQVGHETARLALTAIVTWLQSINAPILEMAIQQLPPDAENEPFATRLVFPIKLREEVTQALRPLNEAQS